MVIGISGKSGSGKSTLAKKIIKLTNNEAIHLDIDKVGYKVLMIDEIKKELVNHFGLSIIDENNIDRKKLGEIVFDSRKEIKKLSDIMWKYMQIEIDKFLKDNENKIVILDWLLLPITKYFAMCDFKVLLDIPYEIRKQRAIKRDNISSSDFDLREKASIDFKKKEFDYVLKDNQEEFIQKLVELL